MTKQLIFLIILVSLFFSSNLFAQEIESNNSFKFSLGSETIDDKAYIGYFMQVDYRRYLYEGFFIQGSISMSQGKAKNLPLNYLLTYHAFHSDLNLGYSMRVYKKHHLSVYSGGGYKNLIRDYFIPQTPDEIQNRRLSTSFIGYDLRSLNFGCDYRFDISPSISIFAALQWWTTFNKSKLPQETLESTGIKNLEHKLSRNQFGVQIHF